MANYCLKCPNSFYDLLSSSSMFSIISQITPSIFMANYSPLSSERGWGRGFVCLTLFHL